MNFYELFIPHATLLLGVFIISALEIWGEEDRLSHQWIVHTFVLLLATIQQVLLYRVPSTVFGRGGLVLDGVSQTLSISILLLGIVVQLWRRGEYTQLTPQANLLTLGATLFALFSVQSNRIFFGILAIIGLLWAIQGALAAEGHRKNQPALVHSALVRSLIIFLVGGLLSLLCFSVFTETRIDEMQRVIARPNLSVSGLMSIQILTLFLGALVMGIPPFQGLLGYSRRQTSWPLAVGATTLLAIVGLNIFLRWVILIFSRPNIGALELEALGTINVFLDVRIVSVVGLVLVPLLALFNNDLKSSFLVFILNPFVHALFAFSFGQRETFGFAMSQILVSVFVMGLLISAIESLQLPPQFSWKEWRGMGRKDLISSLLVIMSLVAAAGLSPFYGSILLYKTLCINSWFGLFLLLNVALSGYYVMRLTALAFQKGATSATRVRELTKNQRLWGLGQLALLIFMGIFWESLYKYGAFSIRNFFGDI
ncbi:MAG: hypothetical protein SGI74_07400 [Oligoflexia bacterium]|nr:hypothetical protein [Oligoflexia bacterium]